MDVEVEFIQLAIPLELYENKMTNLVEALLKIDEMLYSNEASKERGVA